MHMAERGEPIQTGSYRPEGYKPASLSHKLKNALGVLIIGGGLAGCASNEGVHPSQMPTMGGETPAATLVDPTLAPTEYILPPVVATETSAVSTPTAPTETEIVRVPLALPGVEFGVGGPDLVQNPLTAALQKAVNNIGFGVVYSGDNNVSAETGQTCFSVVPEKLVSDTNANGEQLLKDAASTTGVAEYDDTRVLGEVSIPKDTETETHTCVLGYALPENATYADGTLRQLLVKTQTADGSVEVVASMQAGFSIDDVVEIKNGSVYVNGEVQNWTAFEGQQLPVEKDYRADYEKVQADPWTATEAEKAGYDTYVRQQLAAAGIKDAETLSDYDLLEAVIDYQQGLIAKGGLANPEDYLVELPLSLHELIRTDRNNLIPVHREASRDNAKYGIGGTMKPDKETLLSFVNDFADISFYGEKIIGNTTQLPMNGDLVLLYKTPGFESNVGIGAVIKMYDGDTVAYAEVFIPTVNAAISPGDLCIDAQYGKSSTTAACQVGTQRPQAWLKDDDIRKRAEVTDWIDVMKTYKDPNVEITASAEFSGVPTWSDGIQIVNSITVFEEN